MIQIKDDYCIRLYKIYICIELIISNDFEEGVENIYMH